MADLSKLLPTGPREKFVRLRDLAADRNAIARHVADEMETQRSLLHKAEIALTLYLRNPRQTHEEVARLEGAIAEARSELQRIGENRESRWQRSQPIGTWLPALSATSPPSIPGRSLCSMTRCRSGRRV